MSLLAETIPINDRIEPARWKASLTVVRRRVPVIVMVLVVSFVCFYGLGNVGLIDLVDEGIYANAARQMIDSGDWVTPRFGPNVFIDKPPLTQWCQAFFIRLLGTTPLAARLPSAIAAFLTSLTLYYWSTRRGAMRVGWLAAILYVMCPLVALGLARVAMIDSLVTFWLTLAVIGWIEGYAGNRKGYLLMAVGMGLATMTKGFIGLLLPSLAFSFWLLLRRDRQALHKMPWLAMLGILTLLVLPWHLAAWWANGNLFLREYIVHKHVHRFLGQDFGHNAPFWYYVPVLALAMMPWIAFVPLAWWRGWRGWRSEKQCERQSLDCAMAMWALWALVVVLFFSASKSKLPNYLLPALPALALLVAKRLDAIWQARPGLSTVESAALALSFSLTGILFLLLGFCGWQWRAHPASPSWLARSMGQVLNWKQQSQSVDLLWQKLIPVTDLAPYSITLGALLLLGSLLVLLFWRRTSRTIVSTMVLNLALIILAVHFGMSAWSRYEIAPMNILSQHALPALERGEPLVMYAVHPRRPSIRYLLGHDQQIVETFSPEVLQNVLNDGVHGYILTSREISLPPLSGTLREEMAAGGWVLWRYEGR